MQLISKKLRGIYLVIIIIIRLEMITIASNAPRETSLSLNVLLVTL